MKRKNLLSIIGISVLLIIGGIYVSPKSFALLKDDPKKKFAVSSSIDEIKNGDIIFQSSVSEQCEAIKLATHSEYTHCGLIYKEGNKFYVLEAVQPVKKTLLKNWIARGKKEHYVIKRLKNAGQIITDKTLAAMIETGKSFIGKNYDIHFNWSDENIYCSELVWKIYKRSTGIEVGRLEKLRDFDLSHPLVKETLKERYKDNIPYDETVISPASIFNSDLLTTVKTD